jgi:nitroreductase
MTCAINVSDAIDSRMSVRSFTDQPVDPALLRGIIEKAARAPSGGNLQPWRIYAAGGQILADFKQHVAERLLQSPKGDTPEYRVYPPNLPAPYEAHRVEVGEDMYGTMGIARDDRASRRAWFAHNFQFFGAPVALFCFVDRCMGPPQWSDLGMYLQSIMLLLREAGLDSCAQECWSAQHVAVTKLVQAPPELMLFCGMAIGYKDARHPVNALRTKRGPVAEYATFLGL